MAEDAAAADPYSSQKANIRDTIKYLGGAYAACGTLLFAGLSLSKIGSHGNGRLAIILLAGAVAFGFVLAGIGAVFAALKGDFCFPHRLETIAKVFLDEHARDLYPPGQPTYDALLTARDNQETQVEDFRQKLSVTAAGAAQDALKTQYDDAAAVLRVYDAAVTRAVSLAHLFLLQRRLEELQAKLARWTVGAILATLIAAYAITLPTPPEQPDGGRCFGSLVTRPA